MLITAALLAPAPSRSGEPGALAEGIVYVLFDDASGDRLGRVLIERINLEHRRQGFLRVAWRPLLVCEGVVVEFDRADRAEPTGAKILGALRLHHVETGCELRNVTIRFRGRDAREITAASARINSDGTLALRDAILTRPGTPPEPPANLRLLLRGPRAGELQPDPSEKVLP